MATGGVRCIYEEDDRVDEYLLNQLSRYILYHRLGALARDLGISKVEFTIISLKTSQPEERIFKILQKWHKKKLLTVKDMIKKMVTWTQHGHVNREVWRHLSTKVNPAALPANIDILRLPAPPSGPHPLQLALMETIEGSRRIPTDTDLVHPTTSPDSQTLSSPQNPDSNTATHDSSQITHTVPLPTDIEKPSSADGSSTGSFVTGQSSSQSTAVPSIADVQSTSAELVEEISSKDHQSSGSTGIAEPLAGSSTANQPSASVIAASKISAGVIISGQTPADSITAGEICVGCISTSQPPASSITAGQLSVGSIARSQPSECSTIVGKISDSSITVTHMSAANIAGSHISVSATLAHSLAIEQVEDFTSRLKESVKRNLKDCLKHDWLEEGLTFPLMKYYTDLVWIRMVKEAMGRQRKSMKGMDEILEVPGAGEKGLNILVEAKPGMGKTCSMAKLAMLYAEDQNNAFPFNFVFFIPLRDVEDNCSLVEVIIHEHDQLGKEDTELIQAILKGKTKYKVALLFDGYDEYTPGTNTEIDTAIEKTVGKCFLILTSRPQDGTDFTKNIRNKMDGEVIIEGFSDENIRKCCSLLLGSEKDCEQFLKGVRYKTTGEAVEQGLYELLKIPIMLLMLCVLYNENQHTSLPERRTQIYEELYELVMSRTTLKPNHFNCESSEVVNIHSMLLILGKFAWRALQDDVKQLLINKNDLEKECPDIMKLGLLSVVHKDHASSKKLPQYVTFGHKSFQEFGASKFISDRLNTTEHVKATLTELFPSWKAVKKYREVIIFTAGLVKDPKQLVDHIYEMQIEGYLKHMKENNSNPKMELDLFLTLYAESTGPLPGHPLHNRHINYYGSRIGNDTIAITTPSKLYEFNHLRKYIMCDIEHIGHASEIPECAMWIVNPVSAVTQNVLSIIRLISRHSMLTHLFMTHVVCSNFTEPDVFNLSENAQSIRLTHCTLPCKVLSNLMQQMYRCKQIYKLELSFTALGEAGTHLVRVIRSWGDNPPLQHLNLEGCSLSSNVWAELLQSLSTCKHLVQLGLFGNTTMGCISNFIPDPHPGLPNLKVLHLDYKGWTKEDFSHLLCIAHKLPKLMVLDLSDSILTGCLSAFLPDPHPGLPELTMLNLRHSGLNKDDLQHLFSVIDSNKLPKLRELDLSDNKLQACLSSFLTNSHSSLPELRILNLKNGALIKKDLKHLLHIAYKFPKLRFLYLSGYRLTGCLSSFLPDPYTGSVSLEILNLDNTALNKEDLQHLFSIIQLNKLPKLYSLNLSYNTLTGCLSNFLSDPHPGLPELLMLDLSNAALSKEDLHHLTRLIQNKRLPHLHELLMDRNRLCKKEKELGELIEASLTNYQGRLKLYLSLNNLSKKFKKEWEGSCEGTNIELVM